MRACASFIPSPSIIFVQTLPSPVPYLSHFVVFDHIIVSAVFCALPSPRDQESCLGEGSRFPLDRFHIIRNISVKLYSNSLLFSSLSPSLFIPIVYHFVRIKLYSYKPYDLKFLQFDRTKLSYLLNFTLRSFHSVKFDHRSERTKQFYLLAYL